MADQLPSGRWRARVRHPRSGKQVSAHTMIGGPKTYATERQAEQAEDQARDQLVDHAERGLTVREWREEWTESPLWLRPAESTNIHNRERTAGFVAAYGDRAIRSVDHLVIAEWLRGGRNRGTIPALRAMFNDARKPQAGMLVTLTRSPVSGCDRARAARRSTPRPGADRGPARRSRRADAAELRRLLTDRGVFGRSPGRARRAPDHRPGLSGRVDQDRAPMERQGPEVHPAKHESRRTIAMTEPVRERLLDLPRESEWAFTTLRGPHTPPRPAVIIGTGSGARSGSATWTSTPRPGTTSAGTRSTSWSCPRM